MTIDETPPSAAGETPFVLDALRTVLEAALLIVVSLIVRSAMMVIISLVLLPLLSLFGVYWDIVTTAAAILLCAAVAGHAYPDRAVARALLTIPLLFGLDALHFFMIGKIYLMDWNETDGTIIAALVIAGMLCLTLIVALARRIKRDFRGYLRDHLDEFRDSLADHGLVRRVDHMVDGLADPHQGAKSA